jgi:hypothetical protein
VGVQRKQDAKGVQKRGESAARQNGEEVWHWENMTDEEDEDWRTDSDIDDDSEGKKAKDDAKAHMAFDQADALDAVLFAAGGDEEACHSAVRRLAAVPGVEPFSNVYRLASAVGAQVKASASSKGAGAGAGMSQQQQQQQQQQQDETMILLNLMCAPRRSRLHSLAKTLSRVENLSHICAWTKLRNCRGMIDETTTPTPAVAAAAAAGGCADQDRDKDKDQVAAAGSSDLSDGPPADLADIMWNATPLIGCANIDSVELPRLKLEFRARRDHNGVERLYSADHSDLFITNQRNSMTASMLAGIPHSLLLSNVRNEMKVLVPVVSPPRY